jgi:hypothetical protein
MIAAIHQTKCSGEPGPAQPENAEAAGDQLDEQVGQRTGTSTPPPAVT